MIGASGDNSISEMITAGLKNDHAALPFPQQYITSASSCINNILKEVKKFEKKAGVIHNELCEYLNHLYHATTHPSYKEVNFKYDDKYADTIKNNREKIIQSWHEFCQFCFSYRNVETHFNELLVRYIFHYLLVHNDLEDFKTLAQTLGKNAFQDETLLHLAVKSNNVMAAKFILDNKLCDINKPHSFNDYTVLHMAVSRGNKDMVKLLIQNGLDLNAVKERGQTALMIAKEKGYIDICMILIEKDKNVNFQEFLYDCLYIAVKNNKQKAIQILLDEGVLINCIFKVDHSTPLEVAIRYDHPDLVEFLLKQGAKVNFHAEASSPPIFEAVERGRSSKIIGLLLDFDADLINMIWNDKTLLSIVLVKKYSMDANNFKIIKLLLDHGADANQKIVTGKKNDDSFYQTPLHCAVYASYDKNIVLNVVTLLLECGADATLKNSHEQTPLDLYLLHFNKYNGVSLFDIELRSQ